MAWLLPATCNVTLDTGLYEFTYISYLLGLQRHLSSVRYFNNKYSGTPDPFLGRFVHVTTLNIFIDPKDIFCDNIQSNRFIANSDTESHENART